MNPTISTSPLVSSWTTAGINPSSFEKSISVFIRGVQEKSLAEMNRRGFEKRSECCV
jgi:hypothetical protein